MIQKNLESPPVLAAFVGTFVRSLNSPHHSVFPTLRTLLSFESFFASPFSWASSPSRSRGAGAGRLCLGRRDLEDGT